MSLKGYVLAVDTQVCESFAGQLEQVINLYAAIQEWTLSEQKKCNQIVADNSYIDFANDPNAYVKADKVTNAEYRSAFLVDLNMATGTRCLTRLMNHFRDASSRISSAEDAICSRGEALFIL